LGKSVTAQFAEMQAIT